MEYVAGPSRVHGLHIKRGGVVETLEPSQASTPIGPSVAATTRHPNRAAIAGSEMKKSFSPHHAGREIMEVMA